MADSTTTAQQPVLRIEGVSRIFRMGEVEVPALVDVDMTIDAGEFIAILGPSGSGKSTLLNMIGGTDRPTNGRVWHGNQDLAVADDGGLTEYRREKIGFIFQFYNLVPSLTAYENVQVATELVDDPPDLRFTGPDGLPHTTVQVVHVSNNPYLLEVRGAGGRPRLDGGELGVVTAELADARGVTEMFARAALGMLDSAPGFNAWTTVRFEVDSDGPIAAGVDGEAVELQSPAEFTIEPAALTVRIPEHAVGRSPAAFVPQVRHAMLEVLRRAFLPTDHWRPLPRRD